MWGDSHIAAGFITDELTKFIEAKGLRVDTRNIPASVGRPGVRLPIRKVCKGDGWQFEAAYRGTAVVKVGSSLANLRSTRAGDYLWLDLRHRDDHLVRVIEVRYLPPRRPASIGVRVDDGAEVRFELGEEGVLPIKATSSISTIKLRVLQGDFVLHGFTLDYREPSPVTIDVFGLPSATMTAWSNADLSYLKKSIDSDSYDAIVLEYGTNEGAVDRFDSAKYAALLTESLRNMRVVFPDSACLLMGPTDRGVRIPQGKRTGRVDLLKYARIHREIARIQAQTGERFGCALWDWQRDMGGPGSMYRWARETPALAAADLIHLTPAGYRRTANALAQSLGWLTP